MIDLFQENSSDDLPEYIDLTYEQVESHWSDWLIWRSLGRRNSVGEFEPSVNYVEAMQGIPEEALDVFFKLDSVYAKMESQYRKQTAGKGNH